MSYELIDSGGEKKLEKFGDHLLNRPCFQAIWEANSAEKGWKEAEYIFSREGKNHWKRKGRDESWVMEYEGLSFFLNPTDFGHIGLFPEHAMLWKWIASQVCEGFEFLNLFAYTGAASLAAAKGGAKVCHVDASKKSIDWAKQNAKLSGLEGAPIRWIVDDAMKFIRREVKRGRHYQGILLDPPSFGRGAQGQVFKIETDLLPMLRTCRELLDKKGQFLILSCHTPGLSPLILENLMGQVWPGASFKSGEMVIEGSPNLPCGSYVKWERQ